MTSYLHSLGFAIVDADEALTAVTQANTPTLAALADAFGSVVMNPDGSYNRKFMAKLIFSDSNARFRLNSITHKAIGQHMTHSLKSIEAKVVFLAIPLFREAHREMFKLDEVWAVICPVEIAIQRLVEGRGMSVQDAESRIVSQSSNEERVALSDVVIVNEGTIDDLYREVKELVATRVASE